VAALASANAHAKDEEGAKKELLNLMKGKEGKEEGNEEGRGNEGGTV
jgi:hypothetical protein